jgi:simple sugar transport system permease protein
MTTAARTILAATTARSAPVVRWLGWILLALVLYSAILVVFGKDPLRAYVDIVSQVLLTPFGRSEWLVSLTPLLIAALAVALPARIGLVNVGGEGQLFMGGLGATLPVMAFPSLPAPILLPLMALGAFVVAGVWGAIPGFLRARGWLNEVFTTLLSNYIAVLAVFAVVYGPWRDPGSGNYPQSPLFPDAAWLPRFGDTRVSVFIIVGVLGVAALWALLRYTRWGLAMRAIGGNPDAARRAGLPIERYVVVLMFIAGGVAGLAGMAQTAGLFHRLSPGISSGIGYTGFLVAWLAGQRPWPILVVAALLAMLMAGGDILQITQGLPYAAVNVLMALVLFVVLAARARGGQR